MRLAQLARKISKTQAEVVAYLASENIAIEDNANTRLEDHHTRLVLQRWAPDLLVEALEDPETEPAFAQPEKPVEPELEVSQNEQPEETIEGGSEPPAELPEVIKAPKVELPGLRVIGKIALPEPKKKAEEKKEEATGTTLPREDRRNVRRRNTADERSRKNPVALQREREAREAREKREQELEAQKRKKTEHYLKTVKKIHQPTKAARQVEEPVERLVTEVAPPPKTWLGKFWRWLST